MENTQENKSILEKVIRYLVNHPMILVVSFLYFSTWGSLLVHTIGTIFLLSALIFYLNNVRFNEGRAYERAIQEAKHPDTQAIRQDAHADLFASMKKAIGITEKKS